MRLLFTFLGGTQFSFNGIGDSPVWRMVFGGAGREMRAGTPYGGSGVPTRPGWSRAPQYSRVKKSGSGDPPGSIAAFPVCFLSCFPLFCLSLLRGLSCPIALTIASSPNGSPQGGALQTFLQKQKARAARLAPQPAPDWLAARGVVPRFFARSPLAGDHPRSGEQLETVLAKKRPGWSGGYSRRSVFIVHHASSGI